MPYARRYLRRYTPLRRRLRYPRRTYGRRRLGYTRRYGGRPFYKRRRLVPGTLSRRSEADVVHKWPFPTIMYTKFVMEDVWDLGTDPASETVARWVNLYTNNPYDRVAGVSSSSCSGFPPLLTVYKLCLCFACKIVATFNVYQGHQCIGYILMEDHNMLHVGGVTRDFLRENPSRCRSKPVYIYTNSSNTRRTNSISMYRRIKTIEQKKELEPTVYSCNHDSGPNVLTLGQVGTINIGTGAQPGNCRTHVKIRITYYCRCYDRKDLDA